MIRKEIYPLERIFPYIHLHTCPYECPDDCRLPKRVEFDGDRIKMGSVRYKVFKFKGSHCYHCGIEGRFFAKERTKDQETYHLNLYAINEHGEEVLMTKDHIVPKSKGGYARLDNLQPLCAPCNVQKGDNDEWQAFRGPISCIVPPRMSSLASMEPPVSDGLPKRGRIDE